jgi:hypothetical protein
MAFDFGLSDQDEKLRIAAGFAPSPDKRARFPCRFPVSDEESPSALEDRFAEIGCRMRHDGARCVSNGTISSPLIWRDIA